MWCSAAWASAREVAWPAEGVNAYSRTTEARNTAITTAIILTIPRSSRNCQLRRLRLSCLFRLLSLLRLGSGRVGSYSTSSPPPFSPSPATERRAPSTLNCSVPPSVRTPLLLASTSGPPSPCPAHRNFLPGSKHVYLAAGRGGCRLRFREARGCAKLTEPARCGAYARADTT